MRITRLTDTFRQVDMLGERQDGDTRPFCDTRVVQSERLGPNARATVRAIGKSARIASAEVIVAPGEIIDDTPDRVPPMRVMIIFDPQVVLGRRAVTEPDMADMHVAQDLDAVAKFATNEALDVAAALRTVELTVNSVSGIEIQAHGDEVFAAEL